MWYLILLIKISCKRQTKPSVKNGKNLLRMIKGTSTGVNKYYGK